jgi:hypothetical protein
VHRCAPVAPIVKPIVKSSVKPVDPIDEHAFGAADVCPTASAASAAAEDRARPETSRGRKLRRPFTLANSNA